MYARPPRVSFRRRPLPHLIALLGASLALGAQADGFIEDSHANLTLRNYYLDRDYQDDDLKDRWEEWREELEERREREREAYEEWHERRRDWEEEYQERWRDYRRYYRPRDHDDYDD